MINFHNHMIESNEQKIQRVSDKIQKLMSEEGVVFDVQMIPQIRMVVLPKKDEKNENLTIE